MEVIERELRKIEKAESRMRAHAEGAATPAWKRMLEERVPEKVMAGLQKAFSKAFCLLLEKGVGVIEKTYDREALEQEFLARDRAVAVRGGRKELRRLKADTARKQAAVILGSAVEGLGLGALGIGMPDIVIWLGVLLRSVWETALTYGYRYESPEEKLLLLKMMEASMQTGAAWVELNAEVDEILCRKTLAVSTRQEIDRQIERTTTAFATDMLVMKFIQGLPVVGIVGGAANPIYYRKVMRYVQLKYKKRYLLSKNHLT